MCLLFRARKSRHLPDGRKSAPQSIHAQQVEASLQHCREVEWDPSARVAMADLAEDMKLYCGDVEQATRAITQSLEVDVRSSYMTNKVSERTSDASREQRHLLGASHKVQRCVRDLGYDPGHWWADRATVLVAFAPNHHAENPSLTKPK